MHIIINELGRIRDAEIEVKPMMVFTGDSGLGKSYTAFLIDHLYKVIATDRIGYFVRERLQALGEKKIEQGFSFKFKDFRLWLNQDTPHYLGYLLGNGNFKCDVSYVFDIDDDMPIIVSCSEEQSMKQVNVNDTVSFFPINFSSWETIYTSAVGKFLSEIVMNRDLLLPHLLPPARAAFMGAKNALASHGGIGMYVDFIRLNDKLTDTPPRKNPDDQFFLSMMRHLTQGELEVEDNQTYLRLSPDSRIPISAAASSVKELAILLRLLQSTNKLEGYSILFEEPEAHIHPKNQNLVADLIARCFNRGMMFQITTHSDFILSRLNQLIRLGNMRRDHPERFKQFCKENKQNENLYLDNARIGAYYFKEQGGKVVVERQDIANGIPFTTFHEIVDRQEQMDDLIEQYMEEDGQ